MTMEQQITIQNDDEQALVKGEDLDKLTILTVYDLKRLLEQYGDEQNRRLAQVVRELRREIHALKAGGVAVKAEDDVDVFQEDQLADMVHGGQQAQLHHQTGQQQMDPGQHLAQPGMVAAPLPEEHVTKKPRRETAPKAQMEPDLPPIEITPEVLASIPEELPIQCGHLMGTFLVHDYLRFSRSAKCVRLPDDRHITGTQFEKEAGYETVKKWKMSCRLTINDVQISVERWLKANRLEVGRARSTYPKDDVGLATPVPTIYADALPSDGIAAGDDAAAIDPAQQVGYFAQYGVGDSDVRDQGQQPAAHIAYVQAQEGMVMTTADLQGQYAQEDGQLNGQNAGYGMQQGTTGNAG